MADEDIKNTSYFFKVDVPLSVIYYTDGYVYVIERKHIRYFFGPLNKTVIARIKVFFATHVQSLGLGFKAVKVKMKNPTRISGVLINNCKSWAAYRAINTQLGTKCFNECGFTRAHIAME